MNIFTKGTVAQTRTMREGLTIIRDIIRNHDFGPGLSTTELYKLASEAPAPEGFRGDPRLDKGPGETQGIPIPPNNSHPIRSKSFLKKSILPALEGSGELMKVVVRKEVFAPVHKIKKGKIMQKVVPGTGDASPENPAEVHAWVWKPLSEEERSAFLSRQPTPKARQTADEVTENPLREDLPHLNRRRRRQRQ